MAALSNKGTVHKKNHDDENNPKIKWFQYPLSVPPESLPILECLQKAIPLLHDGKG